MFLKFKLKYIPLKTKLPKPKYWAMLIALSLISCAGTDNREEQAEKYALLETQLIAQERLEAENIRNNLRAPVTEQVKIQNEIEPRQFTDWEFKIASDPSNLTESCALLSDIREVWDGKLTTQAQVQITKTHIYLRTDAILSTDGTDSGFRVDSSLPYAFDDMLNEVTAKIDKKYGALLDAMLTGTVLSVSFTIQSEVNSNYNVLTIDLDLSEFNNAYSILSNCS